MEPQTPMLSVKSPRASTLPLVGGCYMLAGRMWERESGEVSRKFSLGMLCVFFFCVHLSILSSVSLKTKLAAIDLHRLISDVRRRVEHEVTFEGNERRIKFVNLI